MRSLTPRLAALAAGLGCLVTLPLAAAPPRSPQDDAPAFEDSRLFIEYNATDRDIGVQISADAEEWKSIKVLDTHGKKIFEVTGKGPIAALGGSELFVESGEPSLDDLSLNEFLALYPAGVYKFIGVTPDGETFVGRAHLTHAIPAAPVLTGPGDEPQDRNDVVVSWRSVPDPAGSHIVMYQVILEHGDPVRTFQVDLPASATSLRIAPEYLQAGTAYGFEVIAWETGGNHTISEGSFTTH